MSVECEKKNSGYIKEQIWWIMASELAGCECRCSKVEIMTAI